MVYIEKVVRSDRCSGCGACYNSCPTGAIQMVYSAEGFLTPTINTNTCVNCKRCVKVCPALRDIRDINPMPLSSLWGGYHINETIRMNSSSGGAFYALANSVLRDGGVVCGATIDGIKVHHIIVDNEQDLQSLLGSKYVQSDTRKVFQEIKSYLDKKQQVLFCGAPCQVAGLKSCLGENYDNLLCVGFICHGVPSPKIWEEYITHKILNDGYGEVEKIDFRSKWRYGWHNFGLEITGSKKTTFTHARKDLFYNGFLENLYLNNCCYECIYKGKQSVCDLMIADFWGAQEYAPIICTPEQDRKGLSLVCVFSNKGLTRLEKCKREFAAVQIEDFHAYECNSAAIQSAARNINRRAFYFYRKKNGTIAALNKYARYTFFKKVVNLVKWRIRRVLAPK